MKNFSFLILALTFFIALPSYSNPIYEKNNFGKMRKRFERVDTNDDGHLSKGEMIEAHRDRIDKLFLKFDKDGDSKLSKKELRSLRKEIKKKIYKMNKKIYKLENLAF
tara:strand:+ start:138 stop:461 length:324 start_codon:yes stop_codon:yes gene_type:complete